MPETAINYLTFTPQVIQKKIRQLEQKMQKHAKNLEFEEAARIRDQLYKLRSTMIQNT